jgi:hypothetical protein
MSDTPDDRKSTAETRLLELMKELRDEIQGLNADLDRLGAPKAPASRGGDFKRRRP